MHGDIAGKTAYDERVATEADGSSEERVAALERALAEKEREVESLRAELARFRAMVEHAHVGMFQDDGTGQCVYVNDAWRKIMGLPGDEGLGQGWQKTFHPDDIAAVEENLVLSRTSGMPFVADHRVLRPDGTTRWVQGTIVPMKSPEGTLLGFVGTNFDITARVEARLGLEQDVALRSADLRRTSDELRIFAALAEHAADAFVLASPEGDVTYVNDAYHRLLGDGAGVLGTPLVDAIRPADASVRDVLYAALIDGSTYRGTLTLRGADGAALPAQVDCYVVRAGPEGVLGLAAIIRDLSEDQRAEVERAELEAKVIASQDALIRELSTPLVPIAEGVIAMPLVGSIGDARAQQILEALLEGIQAHQATTAILDITGVPSVDASAANALISAAQAARLLGTKVILSGIGPAVARTLVDLGVEMRGTTTKSTLAAAIAEAIGGAWRRR
ncbi:PAS domain S-box protein [Polyangium sorediatum]|uniref:PAS domain S-box protein n=1 Tax=Polyangium sorediatum TaxID=889274 RepID=A0ABT6NR04_9BACT|nr:PAS domain S-box protein [Polyangium sorediatum]MDI1430743.1 PAS domain S-box protein [Polyangium sorediatum]